MLAATSVSVGSWQMALFTKEQPPARPVQRAEPPAAAGNTFIGSNITVAGTITGADFVVIDGTVRGEIDLSGDLRIGSRAQVEAKVHARNVLLEGRLTGDVSADDRVELLATAVLDGNIKAPKIVVAEGAKFRGSVDMGSTRPKQMDAPPEPAKARQP